MRGSRAAALSNGGCGGVWRIRRAAVFGLLARMEDSIVAAGTAEPDESRRGARPCVGSNLEKDGQGNRIVRMIGQLNGDFVIKTTPGDDIAYELKIHGEVEFHEDGSVIEELEPEAFVLLRTAGSKCSEVGRDPRTNSLGLRCSETHNDINRLFRLRERRRPAAAKPARAAEARRRI